MEYKPYKEYELHDMFKEPRRISQNPYRLFAAYMLSCLFELRDDSDDDEPIVPENTWGWLVSKTMLDKVVVESIEDFINACDNDLTIDIWGRGYSIRRANKLDRRKLKNVFEFPIVHSSDGDSYRVIKNGIMNLEEPVNNDDSLIMQFRRNKKYLEEVIRMAMDDEHDGYDKLTDMEITMYCWHIFCNKGDCRDYWVFRTVYGKYLYTSEEDDKSCWTDKVIKEKRHDTEYLFSANKVQQWNKEHKQKSVINI